MNSRPRSVPGWGGEMQRASDAPLWKPKGTELGSRPQNAYLPWHCQAQARCALGDKEQNVALKWWCVSRIKALDFQSHFKIGGK